MAKHNAHRFWTRLFCVILCLTALLPCLAVPAAAEESQFDETLIDTTQYIYVGIPVNDTASAKSKEAYQHIDMSILFNYPDREDADMLNPNFAFMLKGSGAFDKTHTNTEKIDLNWFLQVEGYKNNNDESYVLNDRYEDLGISVSDLGSTALTISGAYTTKKKSSGHGSALSFPFLSTLEPDYRNGEDEYAVDTLASLTSSLNSILREVNGMPFSSVSEMVNKSILIRPDDEKNMVLIPTKTTSDLSSESGYLIVYADLQSLDVSIKDASESYGGEVSKTIKNADKTSYVYETFDSVTSAQFIKENFADKRLTAKQGLVCYIVPYTLKRTLVRGSYVGTYSFDCPKSSFYEYAFPKGRTNIVQDPSQSATGNNLYIERKFSSDTEDADKITDGVRDVPWITIHMLAFYANTVYKQCDGLSVQTVQSSKHNAITQFLSNLLQDMLRAVRSFLGMEDATDLVFKSKSAENHYGIMMGTGWWASVSKYSVLFQVIAWGILIFGLLKMAIDLNLSTINPQKRLDLYQMVEKFILAGIGLVILFPAVQFLLECNDAIVELFATQVDTSGGELVLPTSGNWLLDIILAFIWNGVLIYINFVYILRSVTIAILIASGPFFISTGAISSNGKSSLFSNWAKELLANIFLQACHSFILAFLLELIGSSGKPIYAFAILVSFVPLTEMFRSLIFGNAGSAVMDMAHSTADIVNQAAGGLAKGAVKGVGALAGAAGKEMSGDESPKEENSTDGGGGGGGKSNSHGLANALMKKVMDRANTNSKSSVAGHLAGAAAIGAADIMAHGVGAVISSSGTLSNIGSFGHASGRLGEEISDAVADNGVFANAARGFENGAYMAHSIQNNSSRTSKGNPPGREANHPVGTPPELPPKPDDDGSAESRQAMKKWQESFDNYESSRKRGFWSTNAERTVHNDRAGTQMTAYKMDYGADNAPIEFLGDNSGGGSLEFENRQQCAAFMRSIGQEGAATMIADDTQWQNYNPYGDGAIRLQENAATGRFQMVFNTDFKQGATIGSHGLSLESSKNGTRLMAHSKGHTAQDIFGYHIVKNPAPVTEEPVQDGEKVIEQTGAEGSALGRDEIRECTNDDDACN